MTTRCCYLCGKEQENKKKCETFFNPRLFLGIFEAQKHQQENLKEMKNCTIKIEGYTPKEVKADLHELMFSCVMNGINLDSIQEQFILLNAIYKAVPDD